MKLVVAIIRPEKLNTVLEELYRCGYSGAHDQPGAGTRRRA